MNRINHKRKLTKKKRILFKNISRNRISWTRHLELVRSIDEMSELPSHILKSLRELHNHGKEIQVTTS